MGKGVELINARRSQSVTRAGTKARPSSVPGAATMVNNDFGRVGKPNARLYRAWSERSDLVRGAIDIRRGQFAVAEWDIVPADPNKDYSKSLAEEIKELFDRPNPGLDSFGSFIGPVIEDLLVLDAGSIELIRNLRGRVAELNYQDGSEIRVSKFWSDESDGDRYFWYPPAAGRAMASWSNADFVYMMQRPRTNSVVGLSALEVLKATIDSELQGSAYNSRQVTSAAPDGLLDLGEGVRPDLVDKFKAFWAAEVAGKGAMAIIGGSRGAKFTNFKQSNRDMQFNEWMNYLLRKIALVFGLNPQDLNAVADINRATATVQQQNTDDRGLKTTLGLAQQYMTREIVWDEGFGGSANNLAFRFTKLHQRQTKENAEIQEIQTGKIPTRAVNELRKEDGLEPWGPEFDEPMLLTPTGVVRLTGVPTAQEAVDAKKKPEPAAAGAGAAGKKE